MPTERYGAPGPWQPPASATPQARSLHNNLVQALDGLQRNLVRSIFYLRIIRDRHVFRLLGFTSIYDYAAEAAGLHPGQCKAFLRLGEGLQNLPQMQRALEDGSLTWRKADIIIREADEKNESSLIEAAQKLGETELRRFLAPPAKPVMGTSPPAAAGKPAKPVVGTSSPAAAGKPAKPVVGTSPPAAAGKPAKPAPPYPPPASFLRGPDEGQYARFNLTPEQYTRWITLLGRLKLSKEEALIQGMEALVAGPTGSGGGAGGGYLIVLQLCPGCDQASMKNNRGTFQAPRALLEAGRCDGMVEDPEARRRRAVPPRLRRRVLRRDGYQCTAEGCTHTNSLEVHHRTPAAQGGRPTLDNLLTLCRRCHRRLHEQEEALRVANRDPAG